MALTLRDSHSYETQIIDAVRSVNRALGGTYGTSSAIHKSEFNQYEVQLIDAIKGIGRTLSGNGLSLAGGDLSGYVTQKEFQSLSARVTTLENESFFRLVDGNVTLKQGYSNLWVPGWLAAGGVGSGGGGGATVLDDLNDVTITSPSNGQVLTYSNGIWVNGNGGGGGGSTVSVTQILSSGTKIATITVDSVATDLYAPSGGSYTLPPATTSTLGGVIVGTGLSVDGSGVLSVTGGGSVTGYIGTTQVQSTSQDQALTGILSITSSSSATTSLIEWDSTNGAWHFHGNLYANGWIAAGGIGSGGGSGSVAHLSDIGDVDINLTTLANGQGIIWDSANSVWKNASIGSSYTLPIASASTLGGIKVGTGLSIDSNTGVLSATGGSYTLPTASASTLGGIKVGSHLSIDSGGVLSVGLYLGGLLDVNVSEDVYHDGYVLTYHNTGRTYSLEAPGGGGSGTVTSVGMTVPTGLSVSGSPITSSGTLAVSLASGYVIPQQSTLDGFVTLSGTQTITGAKTFTTNAVTIGSTSGLSVHQSSYIDIGPIRIKYENDAIHITKVSSSDTKNYGIYADGFVAAGGIQSS